jgi:hypothetical protein
MSARKKGSKITDRRIDGIKDVIEALAAKAPDEPFSGLVRAIEREMEEQSNVIQSVCFLPSRDRSYKDRVEAVHRILSVTPTTADGEEPWVIWEHTLIYDPRMLPSRKARLFAHEYWHLVRHRPFDPVRIVDPTTGEIGHAPRDEEDADIASLVFLWAYPYLARVATPFTAADFFLMLDQGAGWPKRLSKEDTKRVVEHLYSKPRPWGWR